MFVTLFMTATTAFVLLAPLAMAVMLVTGGVPAPQPVALRVKAGRGCACEGSCTCRTNLPAAA